GIHLVDYASLSPEEAAALDRYFLDTIFPVLTPLGFDPGRPFPHISGLSLNLAAIVKDRRGITHFARIKVPDTLPPLVPIDLPKGGRAPGRPAGLPPAPPAESGQRFVWLEQLIRGNLSALFPGLEIVAAHAFRITRDAEVDIHELESEDLLETVEEAVWRRRFRRVVRLQVDETCPLELQTILTTELEVPQEDVYSADGPLALAGLWQLHDIDQPRLKYRGFSPSTPAPLRPTATQDIFTAIRHEDLLLHHPYESFEPVVEFLRAAARDPEVLAIKMTLYRLGRDSPIVAALLSAIEEGKQVSVVVELKARFDEESNIEWARALEREGVHVVYGLMGLKVHAKLALVVRREGSTMRKYLHLGTGNYNPLTARVYTDLSLFTCDEELGNDAVALFNRLTGYSEEDDFRKLAVAPVNLRARLHDLIRREMDLCRRGQSGPLIAKINGLDDPETMALLYEASRAGVRVDLLVRGICCLRPGLAGISENIRVTSIIGRFLEHSRIYYFRNGGQEEVFLGSADLRPRNLDRRIEVMFPVRSPTLVRRLKDEILDTYLADNVDAREMGGDGSYTRKRPTVGESANDSQAQLLRLSGPVPPLRVLESSAWRAAGEHLP
ncbi:MAG TPA: polyphosphate kinase 1, partial [Candidatus Limnocylindrales bacterium]|nr:polyphosphate kinase 1 [Candidatus Limnocylindrales bacterium]